MVHRSSAIVRMLDRGTSAPWRWRHTRRRLLNAPHPRRTTTAPQPVESSPGPSGTSLVVGGMSQRPLCAVICALLGLSTALMILAVTAWLHVAWGGFAPVTPMTLAACLVALALGVRIPQELAVSLSAYAGRRFARGPRTLAAVPRLDTRSLPSAGTFLSVLAGIALMAGVATACLPWLVRGGLALERALIAKFLWSALSLAILRTAIAFATVLIPAGLHGLAAALAHRVLERDGSWTTVSTCWLLIGAGAGCAVVESPAFRATAPEILLAVAALPALLVAIAASLAGARRFWRRELSSGASMEIPDCRDRWPRLLRTAIVAVGSCGAALAAVYCEALEFGGSRRVGVGVILSALGGGVGLGCLTPGPIRRSISGFGITIWLSGLVVAVASALVGSRTASDVVRWAAVSASAAAIGYSLAYGRQTLLHRVASRAGAGALIVSRLLVACAVVVPLFIVGKRFLPAAGPLLMIVSLALIALGGALMIHDVEVPRTTRQRCIGSVFVSLSVMILLARSSANPWSDVSRTYSVDPASVRPATDGNTEADSHVVTQYSR